MAEPDRVLISQREVQAAASGSNDRPSTARALPLAYFVASTAGWLAIGIWTLLQPGPANAGDAREEVFAIMGLALSAWVLGRRLPWQNVFTIVAVYAAVTAVALGVSAALGTLEFGRAFGGTLPGGVPWFVLVWSVVLLMLGREMARLILRGWRGLRNRGLWLMAIGAALVAGLFLAVDAHAVARRGWWTWPDASGSSGGWFSLKMALRSLTIGGVALLGFLATVPWQFNKRPGVERLDWSPLVAWMGLNIWLMAAAPRTLAGSILLVLLGLLVPSLAIVFWRWRNAPGTSLGSTSISKEKSGGEITAAHGKTR